MDSYTISVSDIEALQTISDKDELDRIFNRAKATIVNGEVVILARRQDEKLEKFDEITTLEDLETYRKTVYKFLG